MTKRDKFPWYTGSGDDGMTGLLGDQRVPKYHPQPDSFGTIDEATSAMGVARAAVIDQATKVLLLKSQRHLYQMMAELAAVPAKQAQFRQIGNAEVEWLEQATDTIGAQVVLPREFVISGDSVAGAYLDVARAVVRRAERQIVKLVDDRLVENLELVRYLNRLSSLLFVMARYQDALIPDSPVTLAKLD